MLPDTYDLAFYFLAKLEHTLFVATKVKVLKEYLNNLKEYVICVYDKQICYLADTAIYSKDVLLYHALKLRL